MNKLYIAALTDYSDQITDIFTANSLELLLKEIEQYFVGQYQFSSKEDVDVVLQEQDNVFNIEYKVVDMSTQNL